MAAGPALTPVAAVVIAIFVTLVGTGSADVALLLAEAPAAEPAPGTGAVWSASDVRHLADGRSSAGTAAGGPPRLPFAWAVVALATVLGFCAGATGVVDVAGLASRRGASTRLAADRSPVAPASPTGHSDAMVTRILATHRIPGLLRPERSPEDPRGLVVESPALEPIESELSVFNVEPAQIARLSRAEASSGTSAVQPRLSWCVCHRAGLYFGELIDDALVASHAVGVCCSTMGLAFFHDVRLHVEWAPDAELASWRSYFRYGPAADADEASGRPFVSVYDPLGMVRAVDRETGATWPHRGPSEAVALLHGVRLQIHDLPDTQSIAAREFLGRAIIQIQRATQGSPECLSPTGRHPGQALALDDSDSPRPRAFNAYSTPRAEAETRVLKRPRSPCPEVQIQRVVKANPAAPNFEGLHQMTAHTLDETGGLAVQACNQHFATIAEAEAHVLEQNRLLRSEMTTRGAAGAGAAEDTDDEEEPQASGAARRRRRPKATPKPAVAAPKAPPKQR